MRIVTQHSSGVLPVFSQIPNKRLERRLVESLTHPVERWAEVVDQLLARIRLAHLASQIRRLFDVRIPGLDPQQVSVRGEFLGAFGGGREAGAIVIESFPCARDVARPDYRRLRVVAGEGSTAGNGKVRFVGDVLLVRISGGLRCALGFEVSINGYNGRQQGLNGRYS